MYIHIKEYACQASWKDREYIERRELNMSGNRTGEGKGEKTGNYSEGKDTKTIDGLVKEPSGAAAYLKNTEQEKASRIHEIPSGGGHTEEEYFALPDDLSVELIDGVFYVMESPSKLHQKTAFEIAKQLDECIEEHVLPCFLYIAPSDVALGEKRDTIVQPDIYAHCDSKKETKTGPHRGSPDFVVEVLSPYNPENDLWRKRDLYQRHGIREYWIINPLGLKVYVFNYEKSNDPEKYTFEDVVPVHLSQGTCAVDFARIYQKILHLLKEDRS